jgi:hypothetical protein
MAQPTTGQRRLLYGLFAIAILMTILGIAVIWFLSGGA